MLQKVNLFNHFSARPLQYAALNIIMMDLAWGYVCVAINLVGLLVTHHYALRIYNRLVNVLFVFAVFN